MPASNNPIWIMSSAFPDLSFGEVLGIARELGLQGVELCVFRRDGARSDHIATHIDYHDFGPEQARATLHTCREAGLSLSIGAYEDLIGGDEAARRANCEHLLQLIRIAHQLGGDANDVKVGTFVGYNHELGVLDRGFERNLERYAEVFGPIVNYAASLGVTLLYENCPMEGWRPATAPTTYNNLPCTLAARRLMYALIPSPAHGETYDPSHDLWQHNDPITVVEHSDMARIHRVHVKGTRRIEGDARVFWGGMYPMQVVDAELAESAQVPTCGHDWDRHPYEAKLPGFGGSDSLDWTAFVRTLLRRGFRGPFVIENEAVDSKGTGDPAAIVQGFEAAKLCLAPLLWPLVPGAGYRHDRGTAPALREDLAPTQATPLLRWDELN